MRLLIELNADVGEGGQDSGILPHVQRASIACGGHVGDATSMRSTLMLAKEHGVLPGAHPSYPDPANFGRVAMQAKPEAIKRWVLEQTWALQAEADKLGISLFHVKPHGALYSQAAYDKNTAQGIIDALLELGGLALVALAGSPLASWAREAGLNVLEEAFADRRYLQDGQLCPRSRTDAVIKDPDEAVAQARAIALGQTVMSLDGGAIKLKADTLCLHGEGEMAAELAQLLSDGLKGRNKQQG